MSGLFLAWSSANCSNNSIPWRTLVSMATERKIFKNAVFQNHKAFSFDIWFVASSNCLLLRLFKVCPWCQNWSPVLHNFMGNSHCLTANINSIDNICYTNHTSNSHACCLLDSSGLLLVFEYMIVWWLVNILFWLCCWSS